MCKFFNSYEDSLYLGVCKVAKYVRNFVVFWKILHSWQKFYTTAGRGGRDKFQIWIRGDLGTFWSDFRMRNHSVFSRSNWVSKNHNGVLLSVVSTWLLLLLSSNRLISNLDPPPSCHPPPLLYTKIVRNLLCNRAVSDDFLFSLDALTMFSFNVVFRFGVIHVIV